MRYNQEDRTLHITAGELAAAASQFGIDANGLSAMPVANPSESDDQGVSDALGALDNEARTTVAQALRCLAAPERLLTIDYTVSDGTYTRALAGVSGETAALVHGEGRALTVLQRNTSDVKALLSKVLAADETLSAAPLGVSLGAVQAIVLLAVTDQIRYGHYRSLLAHTPTWTTFSAAEVAQRLADASKTDPRWPLLFTDKLFPGGIGSLELTEREVAPALDQLADLGLLVKHEPDEGDDGPVIYGLGEDGELLSSGLLDDVSKVGVLVAEPGENGKPAYELFLLVRDARHLWLFDIAGREGYVASVGTGTFDQLLAGIVE